MAKSVPKKIGFLLSSLNFGGAERVTLNLAKELQASGAQVDILLMSMQGEFLEEAQKHFRVINLKCNKTYKLPGKLLLYFLIHRPTVLVSSFWKINLCACFARILFPFVSLILWEHSPPSKNKLNNRFLYWLTSSLFYRLAKKVVTVSNGVHKDVSNWTTGLQDKLIVIFNAIPPPELNIFLRPKRLGNKKVVWVGRLEEPKNPKLLLEAFALLPRETNISLSYVGDGSLRFGLEQRCKELNLENKVTFLGFQPNPYEVVVDSDLLVLSSEREGLGNVIIEAMHCGLRVVSTDCGEGIHDILLNNHYGTIVPCGDPYAMAKAIQDELMYQHDGKDQIKGAERFLPKVIVNQFLSAMH
jgi:glycosyltransferase involved in cell wall biosynthesis